MAIENPIHKIRICAERFNSSLTLSCYDTNKLLGVAKKYPRPRILAELYIRYCFAPDPDLKQALQEFFPDNIGSQLWEDCKSFPFGDIPFATDLDMGVSREIKEAITERWQYLANADGAFPVCSEKDAYLLPFYLEEHQDDTPYAVDWNGNEIAVWSDAVKELQIPYQVKVAISGDAEFKGHSLQLPVYLAALVKRGNFLPFDPYRFIATGAIEQNRLKAVQFSNKYENLHKKYIRAHFVCPKPQEDCADIKAGIMPEGFTPQDIRNFCVEFIVKHHLVKNEPVSMAFVGRRDELSKIHSLLNPHSAKPKKLPLLTGESGIGKTALAKHYAKMCSPYEYQEFVILNGECESLPDIFEALYRNQTSKEKLGFDIPDKQGSCGKFEKLIHQLTQRGNRILFILDNLSPDLQLDADIRKYFCNYSESCIDFIATSGFCNFKVNENDVVAFIPLEGLDTEDAMSLLENKRSFDSSAERDAAKEIAHWSNGNAWVLDVIGETLKQKTEKRADDYQKKLEEIKAYPLEALTPNSNMVRIVHDKEINPVELLQPVLSQMSPQELEIAQVAACCDPDSIYPAWLESYCNYEPRLSASDGKELINRLLNVHILIAYQDLFAMHRLTRSVILEKYARECRNRGKKFAERILSTIDNKNVREETAWVRLEKNLQSLSREKKRTITDIDEFFGLNIPIVWHPLVNDLKDIEKERYLDSFSICFAKYQIFDVEQKNYLSAVSNLFDISVDFSKFETFDLLIDIDDFKQLLSTEKRQNAWLADAIFLLTLSPHIDHNKITNDVKQLMKIFDRKIRQISEIISKYLLISTEEDPEKLWSIIETIPHNHSWKTILDFKKITFSGLWDSLMANLQKKQMDLFLKAWEKERRLSDCIMNYEMVDPNFKIPIADFLSQCKVTCWSMTSDMKELIKEFDEFWNDFSQICMQANNVLYIFGEKQVEFPTFSISFDDDYSFVNRDRWFMSLKQAYEKYESFDGIISSKIEIFKRQLELYQQGKFTLSAAKLLEEKKQEKALKEQQEEEAKKIFEFERNGQKHNLTVDYSECIGTPFEIRHIESMAFFRDEYFVYSYDSGLWHSKDCSDWKKAADHKCYKLTVANNVLFAHRCGNEFIFSEDGQNWHAVELKQEISNINNIFYFCGKWWISADIHHRYSYKEKGLLWNSRKTSDYGTRTVFFESEKLDGEWKQSEALSLSDGQIIKAESLFVTDEIMCAICSYDYSYYSKKHLAANSKFIYADKDLRWYRADSSHEFTEWDGNPCVYVDGEFTKNSAGIWCTTAQGLFFSENGKSWVRKTEDSRYYDFSAVDTLLITRDGRRLRISNSGEEFKEFNPGFEVNSIIFNGNFFIAYNSEKMFYGEFDVSPK